MKKDMPAEDTKESVEEISKSREHNFKLRQSLIRITFLGIFIVGVISFLGSKLGFPIEIQKYGLLIGGLLTFAPLFLSYLV